jgi:hypothetical protein
LWARLAHDGESSGLVLAPVLLASLAPLGVTAVARDTSIAGIAASTLGGVVHVGLVVCEIPRIDLLDSRGGIEQEPAP